MPKFQKHILICTNTREEGHPRGSCDPAHTGELLHAFKTAVSVRGLKGKVRANKAGCLDQCEHGPNMVVYPEAVWYGGVRKEDLDEIVDSHIVGDDGGPAHAGGGAGTQADHRGGLLEWGNMSPQATESSGRLMTKLRKNQ